MNKKMAVIGAGTMGRGIAQVFAQAGYEVGIHDAFPAALDSAIGQIGKMLDRAVEKGKMSKDDAAGTKSRLHTFASVSELGKRSLIVEAVIEKPELKVDVLRSAQGLLTDDGILASNTSSISITRLAAATAQPDRFIGMHFFNPVPLMQLVEVVRGLQRSEERRVGKECRSRWSPYH